MFSLSLRPTSPFDLCVRHRSAINFFWLLVVTNRMGQAWQVFFSNTWSYLTLSCRLNDGGCVCCRTKLISISTQFFVQSEGLDYFSWLWRKSCGHWHPPCTDHPGGRYESHPMLMYGWGLAVPRVPARPSQKLESQAFQFLGVVRLWKYWARVCDTENLQFAWRITGTSI